MAGFGLGNYINPAFGGFIDQRRNALAGLGAGLLQGRPGAGVQEGIQADTAFAVMQKSEDERARNLNQTVEWARKTFPDQLANVPDNLVGDMAVNLWKQQFMPSDAGSNAPASIQEWNTFSAMTPEQQTQYLIMKRANPYLDLGTGYQAANPAVPGTTAGPMIHKDNFTPAYDAALGKGAGTVAAEVGGEAASLASKMPGLKQVVAELGVLAEKATYTTAGRLWDDIVRETGNMPSEGALARTQYIAMVDNQVLPLLRDTFGAAFTVKEGETLRATLGDPNKSPPEKKAILQAFIEQKVRDLEALQSRVNGTAPVANNDPLGIR